MCEQAANTRDERLGAILAACIESAEQGSAIDRDRLLADYPEFVEELTNYFACRKRLEQLAAPIREIVAPAAAPRQVLGDYRIIREIGRGGMGVVYEAEQQSLNRRVALKILPFAAVLDERRLQRFKNEALAAAQLKHPNIVSVHAVGCDRGVYYYAMELVDGWGLDRIGREQEAGSQELSGVGCQVSGARVDETTPIAAHSTLVTANPRERFRQIARLGIQAADALQYAHEMGIVHRDIKPSNLLVDTHGHVWITDFGLATTQADAGLTMTGDLLGTLRYMSPEQAAGDRAKIDYRTDIYSLGITLYELLAGQPAFADTDRKILFRRIIEEEPNLLRSMDAAIPRDLETIVLKSVAKEPLGRYDTAQAFADDLKRFVEHRPVLARRATRAERVHRWARRNPALALAMSAAFVLLLILSAGGPLAAWRQHRLNEDLRLQEYVASIGLAGASLELGKTQQAHDILDKYSGSDLVGFEWMYLRAACEQTRASTALRPDPPVWLTGGSVRDVAFFPDGARLVAAHWSNNVKLWDVASRSVIKVLPVVGKPTSVALNAAGTRLAAGTATGQVHIWELPSATLLKSISHSDRSGIEPVPLNEVHCVAYSSDGALAACFADGDISVWNRSEKDDNAEVSLSYTIPSDHEAYDIEFSPEGKLLFAADSSGSIVAYDASDGAEVDRLKGFDSPALAIALSSDGRMLAASSSDQSIKLWDWKQRRLLHTLLGHADEVHDIQFSPDDKYVASGCDDNSIKLWGVTSGREITTLWGHAGKVWSVAFSPDGRTLASGAVDGAIRIWNLSRAQNRPIESVNTVVGVVWDIEFSSNGDFIAATGDCDEIWIGNAAGQTLNVLTGGTPDLHAIDLSADDRLLICGGGESSLVGARRSTVTQRAPDHGYLRAWDLDTMGELAVSHGHASRVIGIMLCQDDECALSVDTDGCVKLWKVPELRELDIVRPAGIACYSAVMSPDQRWMALGTEERTIELWQHELDGWRLWRTLAGHDDWIVRLQFSRDSRLLASASVDETAAIWDVASGWLEHRLRSQSWVLSADFSADGKTLATGHQDGNVKLWNVASGKELLTLRGRSKGVFSVRFSPDGSTLATGEVGGRIHFFRTN